ncbi:MAG: hypothetical protein M3Q19_01855 [Pseudomonadota bacterium]|nr:hypothetical protein [Pseudomonadota bacterium]
MRRTALTTAIIFGCLASPADAKDTELFLLGALHGLHEQEESFGYGELDRVIKAIKPDVILLEVTPEELTGKLETKGRPEYPKVVWPMLTAKAPKAYAMEAAQPLYGELTSDASRRFGEFAAQFPMEDAALTGHSKATSAVLVAHWKSVADTQDEATDALGRARARLTAALVPASVAGQERWDATMVDVARKAISENPGKRILVLGSYRNRYMFVDQLGGVKGTRLVDMKSWLEQNGFGRGGSASR